MSVMRARQPMGLFTRMLGLGATAALMFVAQLATAQEIEPQSAQDETSETLPPAGPDLKVETTPKDDGPSQEALKQMTETEGGAVFRGLDKITARVSTVYAPIDEVVSFGSLRFVTRQCNKRPPEETPEKTAFLEVKDIKPDQSEEELFKGWMFASSPALNALEHPVYDIWLIDCIIIEPETSDGSDENSAGWETAGRSLL